MVSESIVCFETSGLGHGSPKVPFGTVNPLQRPRFFGESSGHWTQNPFQNPPKCRYNVTNCNFRPGFEFSNPNMPDGIPTNKSKDAQHFTCFYRYKWNVPHSTWVRNFPHPPGARFYAPQPRATPMMSPSWGQSLQFKVRAPPDQKKEPNDVQILNMTQHESASKTQTAQYRASRPRLHLPNNNSHELIRCNGDVNVSVMNSKTNINGCNGSREDGNSNIRDQHYNAIEPMW